MLHCYGGTLMDDSSRMDKIINELSTFLDETDKNTINMVIYKKEVTKLERYLKMNDIPVDIIERKEKGKGSVRITIKKRG